MSSVYPTFWGSLWRLPFFAVVGAVLSGCGGTPPVAPVITHHDTLVVEDRAVITSDGAYNGPPVAVNQANDKTWLLTYYKGTAHTMATGIASRVSTDQGATWSPETIQALPDVTYGVYVKTTPRGNLLSVADGARGSLYNRSVDDGANWSSLIAFDPASPAFSMLPLIDGSDMYLTNYDGLGSGFFWKSEDDGVSWTRMSEVHKSGEPAITETGIAQLPNGRLMAVSRDAGVNTNTYVHFSDDMGATWGDVIDYTAQVGVVHLPQIVVVGSRILLFGRDYLQNELVLFESDDNGETFGHRTVLDTYLSHPIDGGYCWPMLMDDGRIFVAYYAASDNLEKPDIKSLKVRLRD